LPKEAVYFGEISLAGGVRPVVHAGLRLREAQKLGFQSVMTGRMNTVDRAGDFAVNEFTQLSEMVSRIAANGKKPVAEPEGW
jgi:DNA repair protein RadA/Sms